MMKGAICGSLTAVGSVICVLATELPTVPHDSAWRIVGLIMVFAGVLPMMISLLREAK